MSQAISSMTPNNTAKIDKFLERMAGEGAHQNELLGAGASQTDSVWVAVGLPRRGEELFKELQDGFEFDSVNKLIAYSFESAREFAHVVDIAEATLNRRKKQGRLNVDESDKVYRLCRVVDSATELFSGNKDKANDWMRKPARGLGERKPIDMLKTAAEYESVLDYIGRIRHGVFS